MKIVPYLLFLYHLAFAFFAWQYVARNGGDAMNYWFVGKDLSGISWFDFLKPGTDIINFITFPLVKYLHLPFWSGFVIFSLIGFTGILIFRSWALAFVGSSGLAVIYLCRIKFAI